ncbi:nuclear transport factor 2 family protein [Streptomyces sp. NPDC016845]|uniref:nuclear transport factor 2 family protein n=1 Tax=Streptomyces sp. NPDC016845 TaxID=3364972 RepID=UPI00378D0926
MRHRIILPLALTALLLTGCSGGDDEPASRAASATASAGTVQQARGESGKPADNPVAQRYVDAVANEDVDALAAAFHENAVLNEPGRTFRGRDAIKEWAAAEVIGGRLTVLDDTPKPDGTTLLLRFAHKGESGDGFRATYEFTERAGLIGQLDLEYA